MNKEEIIRRLKNIAKHAIHTVGEPPFIIGLDDGIALDDAVQILEELEPVEPIVEYDVKNDVHWCACGKCGKKIDWEDKFCKHCGQAVKQDG